MCKGLLSVCVGCINPAKGRVGVHIATQICHCIGSIINQGAFTEDYCVFVYGAKFQIV